MRGRDRQGSDPAESKVRNVNIKGTEKLSKGFN